MNILDLSQINLAKYKHPIGESEAHKTVGQTAMTVAQSNTLTQH